MDYLSYSMSFMVISALVAIGTCVLGFRFPESRESLWIATGFALLYALSAGLETFPYSRIQAAHHIPRGVNDIEEGLRYRISVRFTVGSAGLALVTLAFGVFTVIYTFPDWGMIVGILLSAVCLGVLFLNLKRYFSPSSSLYLTTHGIIRPERIGVTSFRWDEMADVTYLQFDDFAHLRGGDVPRKRLYLGIRLTDTARAERGNTGPGFNDRSVPGYDAVLDVRPFDAKPGCIAATIKWFHEHPDQREQAIRGEVEVPLAPDTQPTDFSV